MTEPDKLPLFVWYSSQKSYDDGIVSVLGCVEVVFAIWLYWWLIPTWFDTRMHLVVSVVVAPLLLLRSPKSLMRSLSIFIINWSGRSIVVPYTVLRIWGLLSLSAGVAFTLAYLLAQTWLLGPFQWEAVWWAILIGWISLNGGIAAAVAVSGRWALEKPGFVAGPLGVCIAGAGAAVGAGTAAGAGLGTVIMAIALAIAVASALDYDKRGFRTITLIGCGISIPVGGAVAILGRALLIKTCAIAQYVRLGIPLLATNWKKLVFCQDIKRPPEVLPDQHKYPELEWLNVKGQLFIVTESNMDTYSRFIGSIIGICFAASAWFYRLSLKSTFWFYWPLVFAQSRVAGISLTPKTLVAEHSKPLFSKFLFGLAAAVAVSPFTGIWTWLDDLLKAYGIGSEQLNLVAQLGDTALLIWPAALVSGLLYLSANYLAPRADNDELSPWQFDYLKVLIGLRWALVMSALVVGLILLAVENFPGEVPVALVEFSGWVRVNYFGLF